MESCVLCQKKCGTRIIKCSITDCTTKYFLSVDCYFDHKLKDHLNFMKKDCFNYVNRCEICGFDSENSLNQISFSTKWGGLTFLLKMDFP